MELQLDQTVLTFANRAREFSQELDMVVQPPAGDQVPQRPARLAVPDDRVEDLGDDPPDPVQGDRDFGRPGRR